MLTKSTQCSKKHPVPSPIRQNTKQLYKDMKRKIFKIAGGSMCVAVVLAFSAASTQAQNLLANPFFEQPIEWTPPTQISGVLSYQNWTGLGGNGPGEQPIISNMSGSPDSPEVGNSALYVPSFAPGNYTAS